MLRAHRLLRLTTRLCVLVTVAAFVYGLHRQPAPRKEGDNEQHLLQASRSHHVILPISGHSGYLDPATPVPRYGSAAIQPKRD